LLRGLPGRDGAPRGGCPRGWGSPAAAWPGTSPPCPGGPAGPSPITNV